MSAPVIAFASPKGGSGKTTAALVVSTELAHKGLKVAVIDADPMKWIYKYSQRPNKPETLTVIHEIDEHSLIKVINELKQTQDFIFIDMEGTANQIVSTAISFSDLVMIPLQASDMDAEAAATIVRLIQTQELIMSRSGSPITICHSVLLSRMSAVIQSRTYKNIRQSLDSASIDIFDTQLIEREAYRLLYSFGGTLHSLPSDAIKKKQREDAIFNAQTLAGEIVNNVTRLSQRLTTRTSEAEA